MKNEITRNELTEEILTILGDEIVATFDKDENGIKINFLNGQQFLITVREL